MVMLSTFIETSFNKVSCALLKKAGVGVAMRSIGIYPVTILGCIGWEITIVMLIKTIEP